MAFADQQVYPTARPLALPVSAASTIAFLLVLIGGPLTAWNAVRVTSSMTLGDPLIILAGLAVAVAWLNRGQLGGAIPSWLPISGGMLMFAGLLATYRAGSSGNLLPLVQFVGTLTAVPFIMGFVLDSPRRINLVVESWLLFVVISCAVGVADLALGLGIGPSLTNPADFILSTHRATGLTLHPNHLGLTAAMALPVAAARMSHRRGRDIAAFSGRHLIYVVLIFGGILVSGSRAAVIGGVAGLIITPVLGGKRLRSPALLGLIACVFAVMGAVTLDPSISSNVGLVVGQRLAGGGATAASNAERREYQSAAIKATLADPVVGQGFAVLRVAHDIYLQLLQSGGVIALSGFLLFATGVSRTARWLARRHDLSPPIRDLPAALGAAMVVWLVFGLSQNELYDRYLYIPIGLLIAIRAVGRIADSAAPLGDGARRRQPSNA